MRQQIIQNPTFDTYNENTDDNFFREKVFLPPSFQKDSVRIFYNLSRRFFEIRFFNYISTKF